ncbi:MAG: polyprenyl synthetase family protein [Thermoflexales bacterium]|nr:polyprenyl synthetase family protein [Thermoflexales bacterium]
MQVNLPLEAPPGALRAYYGMLHYHLGWADEYFEPAASRSGKRVRPVLCLLACEAAGGRFEAALPAAAAIELLHNFSLIHDDIEDSSPTRRGRTTVWKLWGLSQAINAGDGLFTIAHRALERLVPAGVDGARLRNGAPFLNEARAWRVQALFNQTCLALTHGQHLDIDFETRPSVTVDEYMAMIGCKTAALIGASAAIGALVGGVEQGERLADYQGFGRELGLAFQIQDDILGIWGDEVVTGKSAASDLLTRKKTLPALYGLEQAPALGKLYAAPTMDVAAAIRLLEAAGAREFAQSRADRHHRLALEALERSGASGEAGKALRELALSLLNRAA